jgi:hypothetical protein
MIFLHGYRFFLKVNIYPCKKIIIMPINKDLPAKLWFATQEEED